jgi:hypothetical protein
MADTKYDEIGFDNEEISGDKVEKYKGVKGGTDRIGFPLAKRLRVADTHYKDKHILCKKGVCCEKLGPPTKRIGCVVVQYTTDKNGKIEQPFRWTVKTWVFSGKKYEELRSINEENPLATHDLKVTCIEEQYQQLKFVSCKEAAWAANEEIKRQIVGAAEAVLGKVYLGADLEGDELREFLGMDSVGPAAGSDPTSDQDLDSILQNVE